MNPKQLQTIEEEERNTRKGNIRYKEILKRIHQEGNYVSISSIPKSNNIGLNYTFLGDNLIKKNPENEEIHENQYKLPKKFNLKKSISSRRTNTPTKRTNQSQQIHLTIDTKNSNGSILIDHTVDKDKSIKSFFNDQSIKYLSLPKQKIEQYSTEQDEEEEYQDQYIKDSTPGPGSYELGSTFGKTSKNRSKISKISKLQQRLKLMNPNNKPQPIVYEIKRKTQLRKTDFKKYYPFQSSTARFQNQKQQETPGPNFYRPRDTIEEDLIRNIQKDVKGKYWQEQQRFKSLTPSNYNNPGPGFYEISPIKQQDETDQPNYYFKSRVKRQIFSKTQKMPGVGTYDTINIQKQTKNQITERQDQKDLKKEIAFGSKIKKVVSEPKKKQPVDTIDHLTHQKKSLFQMYREVSPRKQIEMQQSKYKNQNLMNITPGPGYYEPPISSRKIFNAKYLNYFC